MEIKKLLTVLVLGGAAMATTQCGPAAPEGTDDTNTSAPQGTDGGSLADGGTQTDSGTQAGGGDEGGGPAGW